jgi:hypothetical protein
MHLNGTLSKQALWERINPEAVTFFKAILAELLASKAAISHSIAKMPSVGRILVQDATLIGMHPRLAALFPATSNQHGHAGAGLKLQATLELISGTALDLSLTPYLRNDQTASADILPLIKKGDLLIRDLGYLVTGVLDQIQQRGAHFLSRYMSGRVLRRRDDEGGEAIDLVKYLQRHAPEVGNQVDLDVVLGKGYRGATQLPCRLVAQRVPLAVENTRLRKAHKDDERRGRKRSKQVLKLQRWEIYITSLHRSEADAGKICELYRLRWRIEIVFKALKSYTPAMKLASHASNANHVQVLIIGWLCLMVVATRTGSFALAIGSQKGGHLTPNCLSLLKVIPKTFQLMALIFFQACASDLITLLDRWMKQVEYHDRYEKRSKRQNMANLLEQALELT